MSNASGQERTIDCQFDCGVCDGEGVCTSGTERFTFPELRRQYETCVSYKDNEFCQVHVTPTDIEAFGDVQLFGCQATLNSNACTCDICVIKDGAVLPFPGQSRYTDLLYQSDCTGVDGISKFNDCDGMLECYLLQRQHSVPWGNGPSVIPNYQR